MRVCVDWGNSFFFSIGLSFFSFFLLPIPARSELNLMERCDGVRRVRSGNVTKSTSWFAWGWLGLGTWTGNKGLVD